MPDTKHTPTSYLTAPTAVAPQSATLAQALASLNVSLPAEQHSKVTVDYSGMSPTDRFIAETRDGHGQAKTTTPHQSDSTGRGTHGS